MHWTPIMRKTFAPVKSLRLLGLDSHHHLLNGQLFSAEGDQRSDLQGGREEDGEDEEWNEDVEDGPHGIINSRQEDVTDS